jgi:hypothetical protein
VTTADPGSKRRVRDAIFQTTGFALGVLFLVWCGKRAFGGGGLEHVTDRLQAAPRWIIAVALLVTLISLVANGVIFWCTIRPVRPLRFVDVQAVNLLAGFLNYAPFRIGLLARIAFHWRVDGIGPAIMSAWIAAVLLSVCVAFVAVALAMPLAPQIGLAGTFLVIVVTCILATWLIRRLTGVEWVRTKVRGAAPMLREVPSFGLAVAMRVTDIIAWTVRMVCVAAILEAPLTTSQAALLGLAAFALALNPLGRFGFREAGVAWIASSLFHGTMSQEELTTTFAQIAVVESAAEAALTIPLGAIAALWCWRRYRRADPRTFGTQAS